VCRKFDSSRGHKIQHLVKSELFFTQLSEMMSLQLLVIGVTAAIPWKFSYCSFLFS
jgi:hypothetical protein